MKIVKFILGLLVFALIAVFTVYAADFFPMSGGLTGGGVGSLDKVTGTEDKDTAIVILNDDATYGNAVFFYSLDVDGGGAESAPWIIDSGDAGNEDWELCNVYAQGIKLPLDNDVATPTLAFGGDTGFYEESNNVLAVSIGGVLKWKYSGNYFQSPNSAGAALFMASATSTSPNHTFLDDPDTGIGHAADDQLSLIAGGVEGIRITEATTITVDLEGWLRMPEMAADPGALADHSFLYAKDVAGVGNLFAADAAAAATQLTSHNFSMFTPDPNEQLPWSFYAENKALGVKMNVDMAVAIRAVEALSGKSFIYYENIPKSVDLEAAYRAQWIREYIENNIVEAEVIKEDALEMVEVDERVLYDVEVIDNKTGKIKIIKQPKQISEKITGYSLVNGEVKPNIEIIYETKKVLKSQLKADVRFDTTDGKFYKKIIPTQLMAEEAAVEGFEFTLPAWMMSRLAKE